MMKISIIAFIFYIIAFWPGLSRAHDCPEFTTQANAKQVWPHQMMSNPMPDGSWWVYQEFVKTGAPSRSSVSAWLIRVSEYERMNTQGTSIVGKGMIAIEEAYYTNTEGRTIKVLDGLQPMQMYVPYPNWSTLLEITQWPQLSEMGTDRLTWECSEVGPNYTNDGISRPIFVKELLDVGLMEVVYDDNNPADIWRRGTELVIRAVPDTGNYDIIVEYRFRDNGQIRAQTGSTGYNNKAVESVEAARTPHMHTVLWGYKPYIGNESIDDDKVYRISVDQRSSPTPPYSETYVREHITTETLETWRFDQHTSYLFEDDAVSYTMAPNARMGYSLRVRTDGQARHRHDVFTNDFVIDNDVMIMKYKLQEESFSPTNELIGFGKNSEDISNGGVMFYVFTSVKHMPRNEDFVVSVKGTYPLDRDDNHWRGVYEPNYTRGRTEPMWQGVLLTPRNIHRATPFSKNNPNDEPVISGNIFESIRIFAEAILL